VETDDAIADLQLGAVKTVGRISLYE